MGYFLRKWEPKGRFVGPVEYRLEEALEYESELAVGDVVVPAGTVTDFASIPRVFWRVLPPWDIHRRAAIIHDYLYATRQPRTDEERKLADRVFLEALEALEVPWWKRQLMYRAVRCFGWKAWNGHSRRLAKGKGQMAAVAGWLLAVVLLTGCSTVSYTGPDGERFSRRTFLSSTKVGQAVLVRPDGTRIELIGYGSDQVSGAALIAEAAARGAVQGVK